MQHRNTTFVRFAFSRQRIATYACFAFSAWLALCCSQSAFGQTIDWIEQFGTNRDDEVTSIVAVGIEDVLISGITSGSLDGAKVGQFDIFLRRYASDGQFQSGVQLGSPRSDYVDNMSADGLGNTYLAGTTYGDLGATNAGSTDAFLTKYDVDGFPQWTRQFGTTESDGFGSVAADVLGNVYVAGKTGGSLDATQNGAGDVYLRKYNANGEFLWGRQFGTNETEDHGRVATDGQENVFVAGVTWKNLNGAAVGLDDVFLRKYDTDGIFQWGRHFGTSDHDVISDIVADDLGNVYISGYTSGSLDGANAGGTDGFLRKYDGDGELLWGRQFGTADDDDALDVSTDALGNVFVVGNVGGRHGPSTTADGSDVLLNVFDTNGVVQWARQFGTSVEDSGWAVTADGLGGVYIAGSTRGNLEGPNAGGRDAFLAHVTNIPLAPGDANGDGKVNGLDYLIWAENFDDNPADDPPGSPANGDFNDDGRVDGLDYLVWAENFEAGPNDGATVPEPGASALAMLACAMATWNGSSYRRRRRG